PIGLGLIVRRGEALGQCLVDVVKGQVALVLRQANQFLDLLREVHSCLALDGAEVLLSLSQCPRLGGGEGFMLAIRSWRRRSGSVGRIVRRARGRRQGSHPRLEGQGTVSALAAAHVQWRSCNSLFRN